LFFVIIHEIINIFSISEITVLLQHGKISFYGDDLDSTELIVSIACHSGFCLFQPVRKKLTILSAKNTNFAKTRNTFTRFSNDVREGAARLARTVTGNFAVAA